VQALNGSASILNLEALSASSVVGKLHRIRGFERAAMRFFIASD
jgi:hypothetical protein